jgi:hypothetical protein
MPEHGTTEVHSVLKVGDQTVKISTTIAVSEGKSTTSDGKQIQKDSEGLDKILDCAGEWTHCVAQLSNAPYQMNVVNATNSNDGYNRALKCRSDTVKATYYSSALLICAPYIRCTA